MQPIGILGGTFDPLHYGHLRPALEVCEQLGLDHVRLIPSRVPVHRPQPVATLEQRVEWLQQVAEEVPQMVVDLREVERESPSWMVVTLESLKVSFPKRPLCLILGMDAFLKIESWHRWEALLQLAHLVVTHRPGSLLPDEGGVAELIAARQTNQVTDLYRLPQQQGGRILLLPVTQLEISATAIREMVAQGEDPRFLLPDTIRRSVINQYPLEEE
ncbi:MAG: nicotinate-nucleotide adenylyltransferase [Gammaproteobacteria bacterium]|mgnify:FL=1|jgi:nicotinate-nucleotide adenylyltransferase|nr:nicotinate-nucleotide adenylyltransferase [Gammaproteobacteria bacterium]MBT4605997.1 nicotinate-nucleotide adenylyltransferase [Thiotrichales bacterium]MBT3472581.1 nicotinate-nucleotide adenylyltransferase [Gammaproteobacteria bacterium]MBT3966714.1 nicotinate-nucleotide adenylyltransferase [Gammaproteobacteria bacterium]MBT4081388.1 nicotinate-nucleotide adenylyltransferase [Gammaproteobacteria bacterium]